MSKLSNTELKNLAKYIVEEQKKIDDKIVNQSKEKIKNKYSKKLNNILNDEESKNDFIENLIGDVLDDDENEYFLDEDYLSDLNKAFLNKIPDIIDIIEDLNKEAKIYSKKLFDKYSFIINQKLIDIGY
jgi:hypothetical protein